MKQALLCSEASNFQPASEFAAFDSARLHLGKGNI